ncbi:MAG: T9SS type A sorting domain-containing protein [Candidatus Atribacteria bacterium]|nr:MAG: T9SS type A sorting domain-containing protein [Candidatus Atribacteria bacterium]
MKKVYSIIIFGCLLSTGMRGQTQEVVLTASKDNSIYEEGELSNGAGQYLFTGVTNQGHKRRTLVKFDLSELIPEDVAVDSAFLILVPSLVKTNGTTVTLYRLNTAWGEGTSDAEGQEGTGTPASAGDATWTKAVVSGDPWIKPGGDYDLEPVADTTVSLGTNAIFGSALFTVLVNSWIADPANNHGVIVKGDELNSATAIRFISREFSDSNLWPVLKLYYHGATSTLRERVNTSNLFVYPDQSGEMVIRNSYGPVNGRIKLYSITGTLLFSDQQHLSEGENRINTGIEGSGIYLYRVISDAGVVSGKFMVRTR